MFYNQEQLRFQDPIDFCGKLNRNQHLYLMICVDHLLIFVIYGIQLHLQHNIFSNIDDTRSGVLELRMNTSGQLEFGMHNTDAGQGWSATNSTNTINDGQWHHVVAVKNGTDVTLEELF